MPAIRFFLLLTAAMSLSALGCKSAGVHGQPCPTCRPDYTAASPARTGNSYDEGMSPSVPMPVLAPIPAAPGTEPAPFTPPEPFLPPTPPAPTTSTKSAPGNSFKWASWNPSNWFHTR